MGKTEFSSTTKNRTESVSKLERCDMGMKLYNKPVSNHDFCDRQGLLEQEVNAIDR